MIRGAKFETIYAVVQRRGVPERIEELLKGDKPGGRPRQLTVAVMLTCMVGTYLDKKSLLFTDVYDTMVNGLSDTVKIAYGLMSDGKVKGTKGKMLVNRKQVYNLWESISRKLRWTGLADELDEHETTARKEVFQAILDALLESTMPNMLQGSGSYAADAVAIDSAARFKPRKGDGTFGFDIDARPGYRTKTEKNRTNQVFGYHATPLQRVPEIGGEAPMLTERIIILPANADQIESLLGMCTDLKESGKPFTELIVDRDYSGKLAERFARPLRKMGIKQVVDIRSEQHGATDYCGALMIDGFPHCPQIPEHLIQLTRPDNFTRDKVKKDDKPEWKAQANRRNARIDKFDDDIAARDKYAFVWNQDTPGGQQFVCPARAGKVRCPGCPLSMAASEDVPLLDNPPATLGKACTQKTIVVPWEVDEKIRQHDRWGGPAWRRSYSRRNRVEGAFGNWQGIGSGTINRGWIRVVGLVNTGIMLAIAVMAANLKALWKWQSDHLGDRIDTLIELPDESTGWEEVLYEEEDSDAPPGTA